ncbi:MAG TPA: hypothetical protein PKY56_04010 [Candidatus Kapabacteria bacterium]|nr:hypothetical protein [Candidatus Kapabacteria bacterium]HPO61716.1 hypothetical protein [Candidatus Kapabacteria bacterium]
MDTILVTPNNLEDFEFVIDLFSKMNIKTKILSAEEKEDILLGEMMKECDRSKKVSRESIMQKLGC